MAEGASSRYLEKVFMDATDPIVIEDLGGRVVDLNLAAEREYGWSRGEFVGEPIKRIVPADRHAQADELLRRCLDGETLRNVEGVRVSKAGDEITVLLTLSLLKDDAGGAMAIASYAKDITDLRRLEAAQKTQREEVIAAQAAALSQLSTPVTELWHGILLLPVVGIVDSRRAQDIMNAILEKISEAQATRFIVDISGVPIVDTAVANHLIKITKATSLMGCECTISGVSAAIAQTIVELGIDVGKVRTTATLRDALEGSFRDVGIEIAEAR
jgi:PAS domain S-box-containing protein